MPEDILIDMPAVKEPINSARRLIHEDPVNCICESQFSINNPNARKRNGFRFKKPLNIGDYPPIEKINSCRDNYGDKNFGFVLLNQLD